MDGAPAPVLHAKPTRGKPKPNAARMVHRVLEETWHRSTGPERPYFLLYMLFPKKQGVFFRLKPAKIFFGRTPAISRLTHGTFVEMIHAEILAPHYSLKLLLNNDG